jgi:hypothetical protein
MTTAFRARARARVNIIYIRRQRVIISRVSLDLNKSLKKPLPSKAQLRRARLLLSREIIAPLPEVVFRNSFSRDHAEISRSKI